MKYLKKFETITDYKVGDYVLISGKYLQSKIDQPVKIARELEWKNEFVYMYDDGSLGVPAETKDIIRYLTPDEIKDFETELNLKKFNI